jgi:hypothetical protein
MLRNRLVSLTLWHGLTSSSLQTVRASGFHACDGFQAGTARRSVDRSGFRVGTNPSRKAAQCPIPCRQPPRRSLRRSVSRRLDFGARCPNTGAVKRRSYAKEEADGVRNGNAPGGRCARPVCASVPNGRVHFVETAENLWRARGMVVAAAVNLLLYCPVTPNSISGEREIHPGAATFVAAVMWWHGAVSETRCIANRSPFSPDRSSVTPKRLRSPL